MYAPAGARWVRHGSAGSRWRRRPCSSSLGRFLRGERWLNPAPLALFTLWQVHYVHRAFVFPFRTHGGKPMTLLVAAFVALLDDRAPHQCNKTSTGLENSIHLAHCFAPIGKVLETELTERDVKKRLRKRAALQHLLHAILPLHPVGVARSGPLQACLD
jgi:hypothetical protein